MLVEFELAYGGGPIAFDAEHVVYVRPAFHVEQTGKTEWTRFRIAGHVTVMLTPDVEESNDFEVIGNYRDVVFKIQEAQSYGRE